MLTGPIENQETSEKQLIRFEEMLWYLIIYLSKWKRIDTGEIQAMQVFGGWTNLGHHIVKLGRVTEEDHQSIGFAYSRLPSSITRLANGHPMFTPAGVRESPASGERRRKEAGVRSSGDGPWQPGGSCPAQTDAFRGGGGRDGLACRVSSMQAGKVACIGNRHACSSS